MGYDWNRRSTPAPTRRPTMTMTITMATSTGSPVHAAPVVVRADRWETNAPRGLEPGDERFVEAAAAVGAALPGHVLCALDGLVNGAPQGGALLLRGLPVGPLPPTPASPRRLIDKDLTSELVLLAVARRLGE